MIDFKNASLLSYQHQPVFFDAGLRYKVLKNFSIQGNVLDLQNSDGVQGILTGINEILTGAKDYSPIYLNGLYFGEGKIGSVNFSNGNDVRTKQYTIAITAWESGDLYNCISGYYSGIDFKNSFLLDSFSESFSLQKDEQNNQNYSHNINVRFNSGSAMPDTPINLAKTFASGFLQNTNLTGFIGTYNKNIKKYYQESYNLITSECSFTENATILSLESGGYSHTYTNEFRLDQNGIVTVIENGDIKGKLDPVYSSSVSGLNEQRPLIFGRCSGIFGAYADQTKYYALNEAPINVTYNINKFNGNINYSHQYSNDPKFKNRYSHEYSLQIDRKEDGVTNITENGTIIGFGRPFIDKLDNAKYGYSIVNPQAINRASGFYITTTNTPKNLNLIGSAYSQDEFRGSIGYSKRYSDDSIYINTSGIKKEEIDVETNYPTHLINKFNIINVAEIAQKSNTSTPGKRSINVSLIGSRQTNLDTYIQYAKGKISPYSSITGTDGYLSSCQYSFTPNQNQFNLKAEYTFFGYYKEVYDTNLT